MADGLEVDGLLLAERALVLPGLLVELVVDQLALIVDDSPQLVAVSQPRQQDGVLGPAGAEGALLDELFPALVDAGQRDAPVPVDLPVAVGAELQDLLEVVGDAGGGQVQLDVRVA